VPRFDSYAGQKLQVTSEQPAAAGIMVRSQIVKDAVSGCQARPGRGLPRKINPTTISSVAD